MIGFMFYFSYFYIDFIMLINENVIFIFYCVWKYCVDKLIWWCELFMEDKIDVENVFGIMEEVYMYGFVILKEKCLKYLV